MVFLFDDTDDPRVRRLSVEEENDEKEAMDAVASLCNGAAAVASIRAPVTASHHHRRRSSLLGDIAEIPREDVEGEEVEDDDGIALASSGMEDIEDGVGTLEIHLLDTYVAESTSGDARKAAQKTSSAPEKRIGPEDFSFLRVIGHGAYGRVFLVRHNASQKIYAMKTLRKASLLVHRKYTEHSLTEREILSAVQHPFIVQLHYAFQTPRRLYLVLEYIGGGELFTYMARERMFAEDQARFYCSELLLALEHLHSLGIIYRDLKPENILIDRSGHVVLTDFGLSKIPLDGTTNTVCGTVEYMAPEVVMDRVSYDRTADWWSFGIILYDLLTGAPPFRGSSRKATMDAIIGRKLKLPPYLSPDVRDLMTKLLKKHPQSRLGAKTGASEIKAHRWFRNVDWAKVLRKELRPPFIPMMTGEEDVSNFDPTFTSQTPADADTPLCSPITPGMDSVFTGFSFVASNPFI